MGRHTSLRTIAGPGLGVLAAALGLAVQGADGAVLWGVIAYFVGKSIESLALTLADGQAQ